MERCPEAIIQSQPGMEVLAGPLGTGRRIEVFIWGVGCLACAPGLVFSCCWSCCLTCSIMPGGGVALAAAMAACPPAAEIGR